MLAKIKIIIQIGKNHRDINHGIKRLTFKNRISLRDRFKNSIRDKVQ